MLSYVGAGLIFLVLITTGACKVESDKVTTEDKFKKPGRNSEETKVLIELEFNSMSSTYRPGILIHD